MKVGKSTFGSQLPRSLFLNFEQGTNALAGIRAVPMLRWTDAKKVLTQLRKPQAKEMYDTIVVDTVDVAWNLCEKFILQQQGVDNVRDIPWGAGWGMVAKEFSEFWREITLLNFGILFVAHEKNKPTDMRDEEGNTISQVVPDIGSAKATGVINAIVDIIMNVKVEMKPDGTTERFLYTRSTPTVFAGSRYQYLAPKIPFSYDSLVNAIGDAIEKAAELDGAEISDDTQFAKVEIRPFQSVMEEAKNIWISYLNNATTDEEKDNRLAVLNDIITKIFGKPIKLSAALPSQQDLVELFISEAKELL